MQRERFWLVGCAVLGFFVLLLSLHSVRSNLPLKGPFARCQVLRADSVAEVVSSAPMSPAPMSLAPVSTPSASPPPTTQRAYSLDQDVYFSNRRPDTHNSFCPDDPSCFGTVWPDVKKALCPNMVPRVHLTNILFPLARDEMGLRDWNATRASDRSLDTFYKHSAGPGFFYTSPKKKTIIYMNTWKAAHEAILNWAERYVIPLEGTSDKFNVTKRPNWKQILKNDNDPCIVTMIRDPVSHFLSGYNEIDTRIMEDEHDPKLSRMKNAPKALFHRFHYGTKQRFEQFVADVLSQPYTLGWEDFSEVQPLHFYSISATLHLLSKHGVKMTAFLPSMDNFLEKWPKFVYNSCPGVLPENITAPFRFVSHHDSTHDLVGIYKAAKNVWKEGGPTARAICVLHAMDYACWEDLPDGIPLLCKDVFSSKNFVTKILNKTADSELKGDIEF